MRATRLVWTLQKCAPISLGTNCSRTLTLSRWATPGPAEMHSLGVADRPSPTDRDIPEPCEPFRCGSTTGSTPPSASDSACIVRSFGGAAIVRCGHSHRVPPAVLGVLDKGVGRSRQSFGCPPPESGQCHSVSDAVDHGAVRFCGGLRPMTTLSNVSNDYKIACQKASSS